METVKLPDNPMGRRLNAQEKIWAAVQATAADLGTKEAAAEATRVGRFLGYVEKNVRGPRKTAETLPDAPAGS